VGVCGDAFFTTLNTITTMSVGAPSIDEIVEGVLSRGRAAPRTGLLILRYLLDNGMASPYEIYRYIRDVWEEYGLPGEPPSYNNIVNMMFVLRSLGQVEYAGSRPASEPFLIEENLYKLAEGKIDLGVWTNPKAFYRASGAGSRRMSPGTGPPPPPPGSTGTGRRRRTDRRQRQPRRRISLTEALSRATEMGEENLATVFAEHLVVDPIDTLTTIASVLNTADAGVSRAVLGALRIATRELDASPNAKERLARWLEEGGYLARVEGVEYPAEFLIRVFLESMGVSGF
jgi:hypothetical protein